MKRIATFSLRSFLIVAFVVAVGCATVGNMHRTTLRERQILSQLPNVTVVDAADPPNLALSFS